MGVAVGAWIRRVRRLNQVVEVAARHGLGLLIQRAGIGRLLPHSARGRLRPEVVDPEAARPSPRLWASIRESLEDLGVTFVKLGQLLSTRPDLVPPDLVAELSRLQDQVPPMPFPQAEAVLQTLDPPARELFLEIDPEPLAAASIAQVHAARLKDGREVVLKVQRPGLRRLVETDLDLLRRLADLIERHSALGRVYPVREVVDELGRSLREELDFGREAANAERFQRNASPYPEVAIPRVVWEACSDRVLCLERLRGVKPDDPGRLRAAGLDPKQAAARLAQAGLRQIFLDGFFHADPHPGNLLVLPDGRIAFLDFGMVGRIPASLRPGVASLVLAVVDRDPRRIIDGMAAVGVAGLESADRARLEGELEEILARYYHLPLKAFNVGEAAQVVFDLAYRHRLRIPPNFTLLAKALVTLESTVARLDPELSIMEVAVPIGRALVGKRLDPQRLAHRGMEEAGRLLGVATRLPDRAVAALERVGSGRFQVDAVLSQLGELVRRLDAMVNRLTLGMVTASLLLSTAIVTLREGARLPFGLPATSLPFLGATLLGLWLLWTILRAR